MMGPGKIICMGRSPPGMGPYGPKTGKSIKPAEFVLFYYFFFIAIIPYTLLNVGKPSWSWVIPRDQVQVRPGFHLGCASLVVFLNIKNTQNFVNLFLDY